MSTGEINGLVDKALAIQHLDPQNPHERRAGRIIPARRAGDRETPG